jgi:PTS system N-acetylglucosamine-specific IIC component
MKSVTEFLQPLGRALMLPIVVLPVAGLMLRLGQPDLFNLPFIAAAGDAVFSGLGLLFAIGVAVGLAKENHGAAGLAGAVCFLVATAGAKAILPVPPEAFFGFGAAVHDVAAEAFRTKALLKLSIPTGILSGVIAGWLYNRFHEIKLPEYLAFFGGRRFIPIVAGFAGVILAAILGLGSPAISHGMDIASHTILSMGAFGLFMYGVLNRLLIVTGLHHILNNFAWFILGDYHGTTGDMKRFFAGDPSAGAFMAGFFPVMMFGLPAACLAMYHAVRPERRKAVGGLLASMALTAFLTGVTEPIEFSFMFLAPLLYAIHAVLTGVSMILMNALHVRLGFSFSAGLFDYLINFNKSSRPLLLLPVGAVYFGIYYATFLFTIKAFDLKTPGREADAPSITKSVINAETRGWAFLDALGGAKNLHSVDACLTRLRLELESSTAVDEHRLKALGARGFVRPSSRTLQVVLGPVADQVAGDIRGALAQSVQAPWFGQESSPNEMSSQSGAEAGLAPDAVRAMIRGLGGRENIRTLSTCSSRLVAGVVNPAAADEGMLRAAGVRGVVKLRDSVQVIIGPQAPAVAAQLDTELSRTSRP